MLLLALAGLGAGLMTSLKQVETLEARRVLAARVRADGKKVVFAAVSAPGGAGGAVNQVKVLSLTDNVDEWTAVASVEPVP